MIKIETHCHTGASVCATTTPDVLAKKLKDHGYSGAVITNHLQKAFFDGYVGNNDKEKIGYFLNVYYDTKKTFKELGLKTFLGAEVLVNDLQNRHSEFILYGFNENFLYDNKPLFCYTQEELFKLCDKERVFMYKAHPMRTGEYVGDPTFMHGAESFNGHFHHDNNNELAEQFCDKYNLIKMSGTDLHHAVQPITAGIYLPENINDEKALTEYIFENNFKCIEDKIGYQTARNEYLKECNEQK